MVENSICSRFFFNSFVFLLLLFNSISSASMMLIGLMTMSNVVFFCVYILKVSSRVLCLTLDRVRRVCVALLVSFLLFCLRFARNVSFRFSWYFYVILWLFCCSCDGEYGIVSMYLIFLVFIGRIDTFWTLPHTCHSCATVRLCAWVYSV